MVPEKFGLHLPMILDVKHIEAIYELWGVDYAVDIERPDDNETPETVRPGYCGAYKSHFEDEGLSFPLPRFLLEALAEPGMAFAQMAPNFFRYFLAYGFPGTMILAPRPSHSIIDGIPNRDDRWREKFFVFKINPASVGDFDFGRIPREWSDEIEPFGPAPMSPELRGLIATLRRGSPRWLAFTVDRIRTAYALPPGENRVIPIGLAAPIRPGKGRCNKRAREKEALHDRPDESSEVGSFERAQKSRRGPTLISRLQAQSSGLMARPVSIASTVGGTRRAPNTSAGSVGDRALDDDVDSSTHRHRRRFIDSPTSTSGLPPPLRASGEGTSQVDPSAHLPDVQETSLWRFSYDNEVPILENPERLALIWRKLREKECELPSLGDMRERDAYVWMAVANAKAMEASNEYAALMERRLADFLSKEEVGSHLLMIQQLRGELEAVRVTEQQREVEIEGLQRKLAAAETEKIAVQKDLDSMKEKHRREIEGRDAAARKERNLARRSLTQEYDAVLAVVNDKLRKKKKETAAEIRLQEVQARIEALTVYSEGGFELEEELERLRDQEISLDVDYGLASVSDLSLSRLELTEVSGDSVDQD
ncbi:hypothetical protein F2Q70_00021155 [Brassica cretica]|uniref:Uncharacterized protein n=1 Tax=Brassica cretica TaxID=69181 RepID=A0A3N6T2T6_BRACR|nr:hypothetical protein F2Q70_00021155 [Brassica cretica]KAF3608526.1 hypothetical protein DY000_02047236 [Brassica cretica]